MSKEPINIETRADAAGFSKYLFYRLFTMYIGVPLMEYVRKRQLAYAMQEVDNGPRIIGITLNYRYHAGLSVHVGTFLQQCFL